MFQQTIKNSKIKINVVEWVNKDNDSIEPKIILDDEEWEIASENDLNSGEFELN